MIHKDILEVYKDKTGAVADDIECWWPNGKGSVRVRLRTGSEEIFTYKDQQRWILETRKNHIERMKGMK